jgi:glutamate decarboxylase
VLRIQIRFGVSRDTAALLLDGFREAIAHFRGHRSLPRHPVTVHITKEESGGFSHL